jgi:hypothetical protein
MMERERLSLLSGGPATGKGDTTERDGDRELIPSG